MKKTRTVTEFSGDSWVLVVHPKSIKDSFKWNFNRFAIAAFNPDTMAYLEATDVGQTKVDDLCKHAAVEIETERTQVNINHAVAMPSLRRSRKTSRRLRESSRSRNAKRDRKRYQDPNRGWVSHQCCAVWLPQLSLKNL